MSFSVRWVRFVWGMCAVMALVLSSCATDSTADDPSEDEGGSDDSSTTVATASDGSFGTLKDVCGDGDATVEESEAGKGTDKLYVGVPTDRTSEIRPGLNQELWDSSNAFARWCNEQGGISGLQIEVLDVDAKLLEVEQAMAGACTDAFALVGGGLAQDNLMLSGKDGTDFEKCGLVAIPAWAVSDEFNNAEGVVTPVPNPADRKPLSFYAGLAKNRPEDMAKLVSVYGEIPSIVRNMETTNIAAGAVDGIEVLDPIAYDAIGVQDWNITAQLIRSSGATVAMYIGEPENLSQLSKRLNEQEWPGLLMSETNTYDPIVISAAGSAAVEGFVARTSIKPFEEADIWPAIAQYLDILADQPDAKRAALGAQAFSSWLLFADSVNKCVDQNDGLVTRECVITQAKANTAWDGAGLHAASDLSQNAPAPCALAVEVKDGKFVRLFPELGSDDDDGQGMYCSDPAFVDIDS